MASSATKLLLDIFRFSACFSKGSMAGEPKNTLKPCPNIGRSVRIILLDACNVFRENFLSVKDETDVCGSVSVQNYATQGSRPISLVLLPSKSSITLFCFKGSCVLRKHAFRVNMCIVQPLSAFDGPSGERLFSHASLACQKSKISEHTEIITQKFPFENPVLELSSDADEEVVQKVESLTHSGWGMPTISRDEEVVQKVVQCLKHSGWGMPTISRLEQSNIRFNLGQIAQILIKEKNEYRACGFFKWAYSQGKFELDTSGHCAMIKLLGEKKLLDLMVFLLKEMPKKGLKIPEDVTTIVLTSYAKAKRVGDALELFFEMEKFGWEGSAATYNFLSRLLCRAGLLNEADYLIKHMEGKGWDPDIHTFLAHVSSLGKAEKLDAAFEVFLQMSQKGLLPDIPTYCRFLRRLCNKVNVGLFYKLYNQMKALNVYPNECTYVELVKGFVKSGNVDEAHDLLKEMIVVGISPPASLSAHVIATLIRLGKMPAADDLLEELVHENLLPDALAFRSFTNHLSRAALLKSAWDLLQELKARDNQPDVNTYNMLVHSFAKSLKKGFSEEVTKAVVINGGPSLLLTFNVLIDCLCKADQGEPLLKFYVYMKTVGLDPNVFSYSCVINALSKAGRVDDAYNVFQDMCCKRVSVNKEICMYLLNKLIETGNNHAAKSIEDFVNQQFN